MEEDSSTQAEQVETVSAPPLCVHEIANLELARSLPEVTEGVSHDAPAAPGCIERFMDADGRTMRIVVDEAGNLAKVKDIDPEHEEA